MIRHISLTNWKAFDRLHLELPEGTSFIVARNGVGKTSLLQALHFGLFGERRLLASSSNVERAVRGGSSSTARVEITVDLNDAQWVIARDVPGDVGARVPLPAPSVTVNGEKASETAWSEALVRAAGVGLTELRLLAAIGEGGTLSARDNDGADNYNLVQHLSEVLGVSRLREAARVLRKAARETSASADNERLMLRDRPERASLGEQERLSSQLDPLQARMRQIEEELHQIQQRRELYRAWAAWSDREDAARTDALTAAIRLGAALTQHKEVFDELVGRHLDVADLSATAPTALLIEALTTMQRAARALLDELRLERDAKLKVVGGVEAQLASIDATLQLLSDATAVCPTCRQPLSKESVERARTEHLAERQRLLAAQATARRLADRADSAIGDLTAATNVLPPSAPQPPADPMPDPTPDQEEQAASDLTHQLEDMKSQMYQINASLNALRKDADQRASDEALSRRLVSYYRKADLATVTADAFEELADSICRDRLNPLAELLSKRWSEVWPGPPSLTLDVDTGHVLGTVAKSQISLADLSGGERAVAIVLLRLLALQGASNSPVLLMDEPLEHLDPRNRRLLASLLVAATRDSDVPPRQILVTTYEESVIRRLGRQVSGHGSNVVYVSGRHQ
ncbi:AAA family ATPase [Mycobacterium seoulense]|uniref:AAA family ATPase n=1 Tax=Mycobacterium seoulense TaxID=386911 RepID=UPI003CF5AFC7